jgi:ribosomal protein S11
MLKNYNTNLNIFLNKVKLKKQYVQNLNNKILNVTKIKEENFKSLTSTIFSEKRFFITQNQFITYVIAFCFSTSNILLSITDSHGKLVFFCSSGYLKFKGKLKKQILVFKSFYRVLLKLNFLRHQSVALHFKNVGFRKFMIIRTLKKKFFIKVVKIFNNYSHNGCRKKKKIRKKFKTK